MLDSCVREGGRAYRDRNTGKHGMRRCGGGWFGGQEPGPSVRQRRASNRWRYLDRLSSAQTVVEHRANKQYNTILQSRQTATSHRRRYNAVTAQHINRGFRLLSILSLSLSPPRFLASILPFPVRTLVLAFTVFTTPSFPLRPIPAPSLFRPHGQLYLIGLIINHP